MRMHLSKNFVRLKTLQVLQNTFHFAVCEHCGIPKLNIRGETLGNVSASCPDLCMLAGTFYVDNFLLRSLGFNIFKALKEYGVYLHERCRNVDYKVTVDIRVNEAKI